MQVFVIKKQWSNNENCSYECKELIRIDKI